LREQIFLLIISLIIAGYSFGKIMKKQNYLIENITNLMS
jgi:hypothetical protein